MYKRMLRSVLVTSLSAGLVLGTVSALDLGWINKPTVAESAGSASVAPPDLGWDMEATQKGAQS